MHKNYLGNFPGGPVVKTSLFNARRVGLVPGQGARIPHTLWQRNQNIKQKQHCNEFNEDLRMVHIKKKKKREKLKKNLTMDLVKMRFKFSRSGGCKLAQSHQLSDSL